MGTTTERVAPLGMADEAERRRQRNVDDYAEMERRAERQMAKEFAGAAARRAAMARIERWNKTVASKPENILHLARLERPRCPCCLKHLSANVREVDLLPEAEPPRRGEIVRHSLGDFAYIGAIGFRVPRMTSSTPAGTIVMRAMDGTFGRSDYRPFCTLRCALTFAKAAHRNGYRLGK